jgi:hypothetical protein
MAELTPRNTDEPQFGLGYKITLAVVCLIPSIFILYLLLITGWFILLPLLIFVVWIAIMAQRKQLKAKWKLAGSLFATSLLSCYCLTWALPGDTRRPDKYLIPDGYVGWVLIEYEVKGAPRSPIEDGYHLFKIPHNGHLKTSSPLEYGSATDEYYYVSTKGRQRLDSWSGWDSKMMIWVGTVSDGIFSETDKNNKTREIKTPPTTTFFVGTEQQYNQAGPEPQSEAYKAAWGGD